MAKLYHLTCPRCSNEFDFEYSEWNSLSDTKDFGIVFREAPHAFSIKCPACRKRSHYHVDG